MESQIYMFVKLELHYKIGIALYALYTPVT